MDITKDKTIITCPEFPTHVLKSKARRAVYKLDDEGKPILANPKSAGKPSYIKINGQNFYSGFGSHFERIKIVNYLKDYYRTFIQDIEPITCYPIKLALDIHRPYDKRNWDLDNLSWIYIKTFQDELVKQGKLPDDNINYITDIGYKFYPVKNEKSRKLIFTLTPDNRKILFKHDEK